AGGSEETHPRLCDPGNCRPPLDHHPDFAGKLGANLMKAQGGEQTDNAMRDAVGDFDQRHVCRIVAFGQKVKPASGALQDTGRAEAAKKFRMDSVGSEVPYPQDAFLPDKAKEFVSRRGTSSHV